ncbi:MAG: hypothetical protein KAR87_05645 [Candidatus Aenigmarchaeota archaeon]|nr:hypothetical protein [Candidatus Aenigmarchaeota archaeon]
MKKSDELPKVDYSKLPKDIEDVVINREEYVIEEKAKLTWDGRQFLVRIPSEIAKEMNLNKENVVKFRLTKPLPDSEDKLKLDIEIV